MLSQNHERDVDRKDALLQMLDRDLDEAEEQYQTTLKAHLRHMDELIELQDERLLRLESEFERDLVALEEEFTTEREALEKQHALDKLVLEETMKTSEEWHEESESAEREEHEKEMEALRNRNLERSQMMRVDLDTTIGRLEMDFESSHKDYLDNTEKLKGQYRKFLRDDQVGFHPPPRAHARRSPDAAAASCQGDPRVRAPHRAPAAGQGALEGQGAAKQGRVRGAVGGAARRSEARAPADAWRGTCSNRALAKEKDSIAMHFQILKRKMTQMRASQVRPLLWCACRAGA